MADTPALRQVAHGAVREIELCRPELLNRFDMQLHRELTAAFEALAADEEVRAAVLSSTGRVFSAGGDIEVMLEAAGDLALRMTMIDEGRHLFRAAAGFPKPLVIALTGNSYGLATTIVLLADAVVSTPSTEFSDPHVRMGLVAGDGGVVAWPSALGGIRARRHLLTGDALSGAEAHRLGVVTDLVDEPDEVLPAALALAARIAELPPLAVQLTKRALAKVTLARADEVLDLAFYLEGITFGSKDLQEAVAAFKERRPGRWSGR